MEKFKESLTSILPIAAMVFIIACTPLFDMTNKEKIVFAIATMFLVIGMTLFNIGAELSMTPMGDLVGAGLIRTKKIILILLVGLLMGFLITIAEPDLIVLANQVDEVLNRDTFIISVAIGVGVFLVIALLKVIFNRSLAKLLLLFYMLLFALNALLMELGHDSFVPLAYDSGGVTTGPITVPFLMAFGVGISNSLGGKRANENSFGFVSLCSVGPMLVVMFMLLFANGNIQYTLGDFSMDAILSKGILQEMLMEFAKVVKALNYVFVFFIIVNFLILKLPKNKLIQIIAGLVITLLGLVFFLTAASVGFLPIGYRLGSELIKTNKTIAVAICFVLGMAVVLAEPAVQVLNRQVEDITGGAVTKRSMMVALSIGVGISLALSCLRILYDFSLLYYLIPGYFLSLALSLFVPPIYTAIAFDSGGVASGPLTSTFILPFMIGACVSHAGVDLVLRLAFGVVAMVAMTPLITIQLLGFKSIFTKVLNDSISMKRILNADDNQIVYIDY